MTHVRPGGIIIADIPEFGPDHSGTKAIKRINQDEQDSIFSSDNPDAKVSQKSFSGDGSF